MPIPPRLDTAATHGHRVRIVAVRQVIGLALACHRMAALTMSVRSSRAVGLGRRKTGKPDCHILLCTLPFCSSLKHIPYSFRFLLMYKVKNTAPWPSYGHIGKLGVWCANTQYEVYRYVILIRSTLW